MRRFLGLLAALTAAASLLALTAGQALAQNVQCGVPVTQNVTLDSDLPCAIIIAGNEVTVDLNGHRVRGVFILAQGVVVENGTVRSSPGGSPSGVSFSNGTDGTVQDVLITGFYDGGAVDVVSSSVARLIDNTITGNRFGIAGGGVINASDNVISGNDDGIRLNLGRAELTDNVISGNVRDGIHGTDRAIINATGNDISGNGGDAIFGGTVVAGTIADNRLDRNGRDGIHITQFNADLTLSDNHTWFNRNLGIEAPVGTSGGGNWAKHNGNPAQCIPGNLCSTKGKPKT